MQKQLPAAPCFGSPLVGLFKKVLIRHRSTLIALLSAFVSIQFNAVKAMADADGFGQAMDKVRNNSVLSGAGAAAQDTFTFPFTLVGALIVLAILILGLVAIISFYNGRDIGTPVMNIAGASAVIFFIAYLAGWIADSGLLGGTTSTGTGG